MEILILILALIAFVQLIISTLVFSQINRTFVLTEKEKDELRKEIFLLVFSFGLIKPKEG